MAFDIEGARKEGYSDAEIADYLGRQNNFDVSGARKEGYSDLEIINHIQPTPSIMQRLDRFVAETPGLREASKVADFLGFKKMAEDVQGIPSAVMAIPGAVRQAWDNPASLIPTRRDVVNSLPVAAGLVAAPLLGPGAGIASRMAAAGLSAAGARAGGQLVNDIAGDQPLTVPQRVEDVIRTGAGMATAEGMGPVIEKGVSKAVAPFASKITPEAEAMVKTAAEKNLPLSPSSLNPSRTAKAFEWVGNNLLPGRLWVSKKQGQLADGLKGMYDDALDALPMKTDKVQAGLTVKRALNTDAYYAKYLDDMTDMAKAGGETVVGEPAIIMDNTAQVLANLNEKISHLKEKGVVQIV